MTQFKKTLILEFIVFLFAILSYLFRFSEIISLSIFAFLSIMFAIFVKVDNRDSRFEKDYILLVIISVLAYYIITYFLGFFIGFVYSNYSRRFLGILRNLFTNLSFLVFVEILREKIVKSGKFYKICIVLAVLIFSFIEVLDIFNFSILSKSSVFLKFILSIVIPIIFKNILLTLFCYYTNKKVTILYQILMAFPIYVMGIFPNLGDYLSSTFQTIFPLIVMFFMLKIKDTKRQCVDNGRKLESRKRMSVIYLIFCLFLSSCLIYLVSGFGRFYIMAIGSESMADVINKGDTVIVDKNNHNYREGQVIAFKMEGKVIVHRIIKVEKTDKGTFYRTKGDYNNSEDGWLLSDDAIIGCCILNIPYIGWPSVVLSEIIN